MVITFAENKYTFVKGSIMPPSEWIGFKAEGKELSRGLFYHRVWPRFLNAFRVYDRTQFLNEENAANTECAVICYVRFASKYAVVHINIRNLLENVNSLITNITEDVQIPRKSYRLLKSTLQTNTQQKRYREHTIDCVRKVPVITNRATNVT